jgi:hypothetical protein
MTDMDFGSSSAKFLADNGCMTRVNTREETRLTTATTDRRNAERFRLGTGLVRVVVAAHGETRSSKGVFEGHAYDLSHNGIRLELDQELPLETPVEVELHMPGHHEPLRLVGAVARVFDEIDDPGPRRMGIQVVNGATPRDWERLERLLDNASLGRIT